jgi:hypothetical protein
VSSAIAAVEVVRAFVAGDDVGEVVAGAADGAGAGQERQVLDEGIGQRVVDRALDRIRAAAGDLDHAVRAVVDEVGIIALAALEDVGAALAVEHIRAIVADEVVDAAAAGGVDRAGARKRNVFDADKCRQRQIDGDGRLHGIAGVATGLADLVGGDIDDIGVVAGAAREAVRAGAADQRIVAAVAVQRVGSGRADDLVGRAVADEVDSRGPEERVVLDEGRPAVSATVERISSVPPPEPSTTWSARLSTR